MKKHTIMLGLMLAMASCIAQNPKDMKTERLTYFSFDQHNTMRIFNGEKYEVATMKDGRIRIVIDEAFPDEKELYIEDTTIFAELQAIVNEYKMDKYKSDYQPRMRVFDGDSWSIYYKYDSGRSKSSGGYMAWPDNFGEAQNAISEYFKKWREYPVAEKNIDTFLFTCRNNAGRDIEYRLEPYFNSKSLVVMRNAEQGQNDTIVVDHDFRKKLKEFVNVYRLKDCYEYKSSNPDDTQYEYHIRFTNGETLDLEGSYGSFMGGKEEALFGLFQRYFMK